MKKSIYILVFSVLALLTLGRIYVWVISHDIPPSDTSDLHVERLTLHEQDNAYIFFCSATNMLHWPEQNEMLNDVEKEWSWSASNAVVHLVASNRATFVHLDQGLRCRACQPPAFSFFDYDDHPGIWIKLGRLLVARTILEWHQGRLDEAAESCVKLLRFSDLICHDPATFLDFALGNSFQRKGAVFAADLARNPRMSAEDLLVLAEALGALRDLEDGMVHAVKAEFCAAEGALDHLLDKALADQSPPRLTELKKRLSITSYLFHPNRTRQLMADTCRRTLEDIAAHPQEWSRREDRAPEPFTGKFDMWLRPNGVGRMLVSALSLNFSRYVDKVRGTEQRVEMARIVVACRRYAMEYGRPPPRLDDLVPVYLPTLPPDPVQEEPFRYHAEDQVLFTADGETEQPISVEE